MKPRLLLCAVCLGMSFSCSDSDGDDSQFPEKIFKGDVTLITQQELDAFGANNYTVIEGWVRIGEGQPTENSITNVDKLKSIREIEVLDIVHQFDLVNLEGLSNLETVGFISIQFCDKLTSLIGLEKLKRIEGRPEDGGLLLYGNNSLGSVNGLKNLEYVEGHVQLFRNALTSLDGLQKLKTVTGGLLINPSDVDVLQNMDGLSGLTFIGGTLGISGNELITDLDGLQNLKNVGIVEIVNNESLSDFCGISTALVNAQSAIPKLAYYAGGNLFNPTMGDIIAGNCKK